MQVKGRGLICMIALLLLAAWASPGALAARPAKAQPIGWKLQGLTVIDPGQTMMTGEGTLTTGYTLEAKASSGSKRMLTEGTFRLTLSAFQPIKDMPGQKAGLWHVQGKWSLTRKNATAATLTARHNPDTIEGRLKAELPFNPAASQADWSALATLPMSLAAGQWAQGKGSLTMTQGEGDLILDVATRQTKGRR